MTKTQLHTFISVCETRSFTQAARRQYISQPAVSRQMAALEDELGVTLFERERSTIRLTPAGEYLAHNLKPLLDRLDGLFNHVREISTGQTGSLVIGLLLDQSVDQPIARALRQLRQSHHINITILRLSVMELRSMLENGDIDIAVSVESAPNLFPGCNKYIYSVEAMCFAARRDLLMEGTNRIDEAAVRRFAAHHPVLTPRLDSFPPEQRDELAGHAHAAVVASAEVEYDLASIAPMVSAGLGGTIVNESHMLTSDQDIALFPFDALPTIDKGVFWRQSTTNPLVELFFRCLREQTPGQRLEETL